MPAEGMQSSRPFSHPVWDGRPWLPSNSQHHRMREDMRPRSRAVRHSPLEPCGHRLTGRHLSLPRLRPLRQGETDHHRGGGRHLHMRHRAGSQTLDQRLMRMTVSFMVVIIVTVAR